MSKKWLASAASSGGDGLTVHFGLGPVSLRRGALFLVNIGIPLLVGVFSGVPETALLGAVVGMLLAFADDDGPLTSRLRLLIIDGVALAVGGCSGFYLKNSVELLWSIFVAMTFMVGLAARGGRVPLLAGRHCAVAFVVASAVPTFTVQQIYLLIGVLVLNAASRTVDYLICGSLPSLPAAPLQMPPGRGGWFRFALAFAGAAAAALWIGNTIETAHGYWVAITTLVVMQPDARATYRRIVERIVGTVAGVAAAWLITMAFHSLAIVCVAILLVAPLIPHHLTQRYWLHTGLIALMVLLAYDLTLLSAQGMSQLFVARMIDILLGCSLALVGTSVAFPREAVEGLDDLVDNSR